MDIRERVARKIFLIAGDGSVAWRDLSDVSKDYYLSEAKGIIKSVKQSIKLKAIWEDFKCT